MLAKASLITLFCAVSVCGQDLTSRADLLRRQREEKARKLQPYKRSGLETGLFEFKDRRILERYQAGWKGFHPVFGGLSTGSGFAFGAQFLKTGIANGALNFSMSGQASLIGYQRYQLGLSALQLANNRAFAGFDFIQHISPQEDFFGVGSDSAKENRTNYRLETTEFAGTFGVRPFRNVQLGVRGGVLNTNVGPGTDTRFQSTEIVFGPDTTPAIDRQPHYTYASGFMKYDSRDQPLNPRSGGLFQLEGGYYYDRDFGAYSYRRWKIEAQQYFPFFNERRVIAFRGKLDLTEPNADQEVPFYLMPTVGGSEDLRGYPEFRFRDRDALVFNLEYRWEAFSGLDLALFGDAANVFHRPGDIELDELKTSYGFGFRFNTARSVFWRLDFGFSPDGTRIFAKFNHVF